MFQAGDSVIFERAIKGSTQQLIVGKEYVINKVVERDGLTELRVTGETGQLCYCWPEEVTLIKSSGKRKSPWKIFCDNYSKGKRIQFKDNKNIKDLNIIGVVTGMTNAKGFNELKVRITRVFHNGKVDSYRKGAVVFLRPDCFSYAKEVGAKDE